MGNQNSYSIIPTLLLEDITISASAKLLFGFINSYSNKYGYTTKSNKELAQKMATSTRTIQRYLNELEQNGYIKITLKNDNLRYIAPQYTFWDKYENAIDSMTRAENGGFKDAGETNEQYRARMEKVENYKVYVENCKRKGTKPVSYEYFGDGAF